MSLENGEDIWATQLEPKQELIGPDFVVDSGEVFTCHYFYKAGAWDQGTGHTLWYYSDSEVYPLAYLAVGKDALYAGDQSGNLLALERRTGKPIFQRKFESLPRGLTYHDQSVYFGYGYVPQGGEGQAVGGIQKVTADTGESIWTYQTESGGFLRMRPIVRDGRVYAGTKTGDRVEFVALDAETGEKIWSNRYVRTYAAIWADGKIIVNDRQKLWALDPETGSRIWMTDLEAGHGESGMAYLDGFIYHPHGVAMYVVDVDSGEVVHVEPPLDGTYVWEVGAGKGTVVAQTSSKVVAYEPFEPRTD